MATSLTRLIKAGAGTPVFDWFAKNFPDTNTLCSAANTELRDGSAKTPCAVPRPAGSDAGLVGTAVEYVLATHLVEGALDDSHAIWTAEYITQAHGYFRETPAPNEIAAMATERIRDKQAWRKPLDDEGWGIVIDMACILAKFEQAYRAGAVLLPQIIEPIREHKYDLRAIAHACTSDATRQDLEALSRATVEDHLNLRDAPDLALNPTFAASPLLGGADADVIANGVLLDFKSSADPGLIGRQEAWQLLGYLLADTNDRYELKRVGFAGLRRRRTVTWAVQDYLDILSGGTIGPVGQWQAEFERTLIELAPVIQQQS